MHDPKLEIVFVTLLLAAGCGGLAPADGDTETEEADLSTTAIYVQTTTTSNTRSSCTFVNVPDIDWGALYFVSPTSTTGAATMDGTPVGVMYDNVRETWAIFNENFSTMPLGTGFTVYTRAAAANVFKKVVGLGDRYNVAYIDNPYANGNPGALVWATQNFNTEWTNVPLPSTGFANPHNIAVWYDGGYKRWAIVNLDGATIRSQAAFNVIVESAPGASYFVKTAPAQTKRLPIVDPRIDGRPTAKIMVTAVVNPGNGAPYYDDHPVGTCYDGAHWSICNTDGQDIPAGASFNVWLLGQ